MKKFYFIPVLIIATFGFTANLFRVASAETIVCTKLNVASWRGCEPLIETKGVISTDKNSAVVNIFYSSMGADYNTSDFPLVSVQYGLASTGSYDYSTDTKAQPKGNDTIGFLLTGLEEGKEYQYRAVLSWVGGIKYGERKNFSAVKKITTPTTEPEKVTVTIDRSSTTTSEPARPTTTTTSGSSEWALSFLGGLKKTAEPTSTSIFKNIDEKAGFRLAIDNGTTEVRPGDTITTKVRYENNNTKSFSNGVVEIFLPDQYTISATNKGIIDKVSNKVVISLRDFPAGAFGTAIITAQATGKSDEFDQAMTQAGLKIADVVLKVADIDEYLTSSTSGRSSGQGASATGAGLPGTIIGWILLLVILAAIVIIGRRYFVKKDY